MTRRPSVDVTRDGSCANMTDGGGGLTEKVKEQVT